MPPYSPNFFKIRPILYEKHWSGSQISKIRPVVYEQNWSGSQMSKIRPVVYEKHWSGSKIRISIWITPNFELGLPMIISSELTKFHQNPTSGLWEILLTNKQTNRQTNKRTKVVAITRFSRDNNKWLAKLSRDQKGGTLNTTNISFATDLYSQRFLLTSAVHTSSMKFRDTSKSVIRSLHFCDVRNNCASKVILEF